MPGRVAMHKKGEKGVDLARKILESTTWIELPFDSAENECVCTLGLLNGSDKCYDAMGYILRKPKAPLYVEAKNYDSSGGKQNAQYKEFLANAYSITAKDLGSGTDGTREIMWFTKHPFSTRTLAFVEQLMAAGAESASGQQSLRVRISRRLAKSRPRRSR